MNRDSSIEQIEAHLYSAMNDGELDDLAHEHVSRAYRLLGSLGDESSDEELPEDGETWYREDCLPGSVIAQDIYPREEIEERVQEHAAEQAAALLDTYDIDPSDLEIRWCNFEDGVLLYKATHEDMPVIEHEYLPTTGPNTNEVTRPRTDGGTEQQLEEYEIDLEQYDMDHLRGGQPIFKGIGEEILVVIRPPAP